MPWVSFEGGGGGGRHSTGLFLTYAIRLTFLTVWTLVLGDKKETICISTIVIFCYYQLHNLLGGGNINKNVGVICLDRGAIFPRYALAMNSTRFTNSVLLQIIRRTLHKDCSQWQITEIFTMQSQLYRLCGFNRICRFTHPRAQSSPCMTLFIDYSAPSFYPLVKPCQDPDWRFSLITVHRRFTRQYGQVKSLYDVFHWLQYTVVLHVSTTRSSLCMTFFTDYSTPSFYTSVRPGQVSVWRFSLITVHRRFTRQYGQVKSLYDVFHWLQYTVVLHVSTARSRHRLSLKTLEFGNTYLRVKFNLKRMTRMTITATGPNPGVHRRPQTVPLPVCVTANWPLKQENIPNTGVHGRPQTIPLPVCVTANWPLKQENIPNPGVHRRPQTVPLPVCVTANWPLKQENIPNTGVHGRPQTVPLPVCVTANWPLKQENIPNTGGGSIKGLSQFFMIL